MFFDMTLNFIGFKDISAYAAELILLFGILLLLLHLTFLNTASKYPVLITYSSNTAIFILGVSQVFNFINYNSLNGFSTEGFIKTAFHGAFILNEEIIIFKIILIFLAILILLVSDRFFKETKLGYFEYNILFLFSVLGCLITLSANDLMVFYISLEIQGLAFYIMATMKKSATSSEAGLKYFIVGSFSSALLLFGISFIVLITGHHNFESINLMLTFHENDAFTILAILGALLIITAILIKLAVAPFHEWVADVYEGIPTPTALFFATIPKISNFFILVRLVENVFVNFSQVIQPFLILICLLSLILGSLNAFKQQNIKRFLAFSSVNHFGFILIGLVVGTPAGISASFFYLSFYIILTFGMWTSLILLSYVSSNDRPIFQNKLRGEFSTSRLYQLTRISELGGLINTNPGVAFSIFLMLISMGGIPPLAGFNAKVGIFFILIEKAFESTSLLSTLLIFLIVIGVLSSIFSVFYYIRIIKILWLVSLSSAHTLNHTSLNGLKGRQVSSYILGLISTFNIFSFLLFF